MLWYKAWLDTRVRFVIGLAILSASGIAIVWSYPRVQELLRTAPSLSIAGDLGKRVAESAAIASTFRGYVWSQWFVKNIAQLWCLFAVILASGSMPHTSRHGGIYTLSLPVGRTRLVLTRTLVVTAEVFALAMVPPLLLPVLSPAIGQSYAFSDALAHGFALFAGGAVLFGIALLMSAIFDDVWRPILVVLASATVMVIVEQVSPGLGPLTVFRVMSGESYFRGSGMPWLGMAISVAASAALVWGAVVTVARRDF
jgi:ABC-2 type transport system permease protein